jgi:hypothetical protein
MDGLTWDKIREFDEVRYRRVRILRLQEQVRNAVCLEDIEFGELESNQIASVLASVKSSLLACIEQELAEIGIFAGKNGITA